MLKQFLKDSSIYGFSGIITRGISLLLVPFYTRVFTPADYGIIDLLAIIASIVSFTFPLEITQAVARFYPDASSTDQAREYASTALFYTLFAFSVFLIVVQVFAEPMDAFFLSGQIGADVLRVAALGICSNGLFYFFQNQLRWRLEPKKHALCSITFSSLAIALTVVFVLVWHAGVIGVFWAQFIAGVVASCLAYVLSRSSYALIFNTARFKEMLAFSAPLVPSSIGIFVLTYADRISISKFMTIADLGIFGIGYRVASMVSVLMIGFQGAITPLVYSRYREPDTPAELARIFRYFVFGALIIASTLSIFAREILLVMTTPPYYAAAAVIPFLVASTFLSNMYVFAPGLGIARQTRAIAVINFMGAGLNVLLNIAFVPMFGILGAATATLVSSIAMFTTNMVMSQRAYYVPHDTGGLLRAAIAVVAVIACAGYLSNLTTPTLSVVLKSVSIVLVIGALFMTKIVSISEIKLQFAKVVHQ